jgi:hypothetical protein
MAGIVICPASHFGATATRLRRAAAGYGEGVAASFEKLVRILEEMRFILRSEEEDFFADWIAERRRICCDARILKASDISLTLRRDGKSQRPHVLPAGRRPGKTVASRSQISKVPRACRGGLVAG